MAEILQPSMRQDGWVRHDEIADMLGMQPDTVRANLDKYHVPVVKFGNTTLVYMPVFYHALVVEQWTMDGCELYRRLAGTDGKEEKEAVETRGGVDLPDSRRAVASFRVGHNTGRETQEDRPSGRK